MASRIITKKGSGAPLASDLVHGELAVDTVNKRLYTENAGGTVIEVGTSPSTIDINAGTIDGTVIGGSTAAAGSFTTISASGEIAANGGVAFGDNDKAVFGAGSDLQIYHDASNSYIKEVGTGLLSIQTNGAEIAIQGRTGTEYMARFQQDGWAKLYYDNAVKLATTATGIDVTGTVTADGLTVDGDLEISSASPEIYLMESDTTDVNTRIRTSAGDFRVETINDAKSSIVLRQLIDHATGDISFYEDTGTTAKFFWDASAESLGIGTSSPSTLLEINKASEGEYLRVGGDSASNARALRFTSSTSSTGSNGALHTITANSASGEIAFANGDGTIMYLKDGGNVGIGTTSPAANLEVSSATGATLRLSRDDTTVVGPNTIGSIEFYTADSDSAGVAASVDGVADGSGGNVALAFSSGIGGSATERARIDSSGNLLVGKTANDNTTAGFKVQSGGFFSAVADGTTTCVLNRLTSDGDIAIFRKDGTTVGSIGVSSGAYLTIGTGDTGILFDNAGNRFYPCNASTQANLDNAIDIGASTVRFKDLYLSGGVYLGGTGAANLLDDYEEGTWTPALQRVGAGNSLTYTSQTGYYTKVGRKVSVNGRIEINAVTSQGSSVSYINGLPFAIGGLASITFAGSVGANTGLATVVTSVCMGRGTETTITFRDHANTTQNLSANYVASGVIVFSLEYFID